MPIIEIFEKKRTFQPISPFPPVPAGRFIYILLNGMKDLSQFISDYVTHRPVSMFEANIRVNAAKLTEEIQGKSVCAIGWASAISSS